MEYTVRIAGTPCETRVSGGTLAEACALLGHPLELVCGGNGRCGKCDVLVERRGVRETVRACITPVTEDITVFLEVSENASAQILTSGGAHDVFAPAVTLANGSAPSADGSMPRKRCCIVLLPQKTSCQRSSERPGTAFDAAARRASIVSRMARLSSASPVSCSMACWMRAMTSAPYRIWPLSAEPVWRRAPVVRS